MNSSLRRIIVVSGLALLALAGGGIWFYGAQEQRLRQDTEESLRAIAELKVEQIGQWRAERIGDAAVLMQSPYTIEAVARWIANPAGEPAPQVLARFRAMEEHYHYSDVMVVNADGQTLFSLSGRRVLLGEEARLELAAAFRDRQPMLTDLHAGPDDLPPHVDVVAPLFTDNNGKQPLGAVILRVDARQFLYPLVQSWPLPGQTAETLMVRREGDAILLLNDLRHEPKTAFKIRFALTRTDGQPLLALPAHKGMIET